MHTLYNLLLYNSLNLLLWAIAIGVPRPLDKHLSFFFLYFMPKQPSLFLNCDGLSGCPGVSGEDAGSAAGPGDLQVIRVRV